MSADYQKYCFDMPLLLAAFMHRVYADAFLSQTEKCDGESQQEQEEPMCNRKPRRAIAEILVAAVYLEASKRVR